MREIKFKAKQKDNNKWIIGNYLYDIIIDKHYIISPEQTGLEDVNMVYFEVKPETVCQFIGIQDIKDNDLYENDNVEVRPVGLQGCSQEKLVIGKIVWINGECGFDVRSKEGNQFGRFGVHIETAKIIGNKFDGD